MNALGHAHTIRSWLHNRRTSGTNHPTPKGNIMKKLIASALLALALTSTVSACNALTETAARPAVTATSSPSQRCEEDMPCWVCSENDNSCVDETAGEAWKQWDVQGGAAKLVIEDPNRPYRVDYMGMTPGAPENTDKFDLVLAGRHGFYVFRASYTD